MPIGASDHELTVKGPLKETAKLGSLSLSFLCDCVVYF